MYFYNDELAAFNTRALLPDMQPKYKYSKNIPVRTLIYPRVYETSYIVLVEGIMDAISMQQDGIPAIMNFGVNNTFSPEKIRQLYKQGVETIYLAFDDDKAGKLCTHNYLTGEWKEPFKLSDYFDVRLGLELPELREFYKSGMKDYNDYLMLRSKK
jgi:DNA primase